MTLRLAALVLGFVAGFTVSWARMTDPRTFHAMLSFASPRIYLLMGSAVAVAFVGARLLRSRRALLTGEPINWATASRIRRCRGRGCASGVPNCSTTALPCTAGSSA
jgi:hypothetical protein